MSKFAMVEKKNHLAVHGIFSSQESGEKHLRDVVPEYVQKGYFMDKTLRASDFEIVPHTFKGKK